MSLLFFFPKRASGWDSRACCSSAALCPQVQVATPSPSLCPISPTWREACSCPSPKDSDSSCALSPLLEHLNSIPALDLLLLFFLSFLPPPPLPLPPPPSSYPSSSCYQAVRFPGVLSRIFLSHSKNWVEKPMNVKFNIY